MGKTRFSDAAMRRSALYNMEDTIEILEIIRKEWKLEWWLEAGTFLGMVREGDLIAHDSDIDFGIMGEEHLDRIRRGMVIRGFEVHEYGEPGKGREISFVRDGVKVDVFCFYPEYETEKIWMGCWRDGRMIRLDFPKDLILPADQAIFQGMTVRIPKGGTKYLQERYGLAWREPDPSWRWDRSPRCINWEKSEWTKEELEQKYP